MNILAKLELQCLFITTISMLICQIFSILVKPQLYSQQNVLWNMFTVGLVQNIYVEWDKRDRMKTDFVLCDKY